MQRKTRHPILSFLYGCLSILTLPIGLFTGLVIYFFIIGGINNTPGFTWFRSIEDFYALDTTSPQTDLVLITVGIYLALVIFAMLLRLAAGTARLPRKRLLLLNTGLALTIGISIAGLVSLFMKESLSAPAGAIAGLITTLFLIWAFSKCEDITARILAGLSKKQYTAGNFGLADKLVGLAIRLRPENPQLIRMLALSLHKARKNQKALSYLEILYTPETEDMELLIALDKAYQDCNDNEQALKILEHILKIEPTRSESRLDIARILKELNHTNKAIQKLKEHPEPNMELLIKRLDLEINADKRQQAQRTSEEIENLDEGTQKQAIEAWNKFVNKWNESEEGLFALAELYIQHKREAEGYEIFEKLLEIDSQRSELRKRLVQYYKNSDQMQRTEPHLTALMDAGDDNIEVALLYGDLLVQRDDYDDALLHFQYAIESYPNDYRFPYFLAQIHLKSGALEDAMLRVEQAEKIVSEDDEAGVARIKRLMKKTNDSLAQRELDLWRDRCNRQPDNLEMRFGYIGALVKNNNQERAVGESCALLEKHPEQTNRLIAEIEKLVNSADRNYRLMDYLAELKLQNKQYDEVFGLAKRMAEKAVSEAEVIKSYCERILQHNERHLPSVQTLLRMAEEKQDWPNIYSYSQRLLKLAPRHQKMLLKKMFRAAANQGQIESALEHANEFLELEPDNMQFHLELADYLMHQNLFDESIKHIEIAEAQDYYHKDVKRLRDELKRCQAIQEIEDLVRATEKNPEDTQSQFKLGRALSFDHKFREAIPRFQKAAQNPTLKDVAMAYIANCMAMIGMLELAEETIDEMSLMIEDQRHAQEAKELVYEIASILEEQKELKRALKIYKAIFRVDAGFRDITEKMERLTD